MSFQSYPSKSVPTGAWDTHHHIFETDIFPFAPGRHFTPSPATVQDLKAFEASIGVANVVIAHGLSYGPDCTSLLHYLQQFNGEARGICVLNEQTVSDDLLEKYHEAGVRSVRIDFFRHRAMNDLEKQVELIQATAARLMKWDSKGRGWSIQIQQPNLAYWKRLRQVASGLGLPLVVDHMALAKGPSYSPPGAIPVTDTPEWQDLLGALKDGNLWVKISAPYRNSKRDDSAYEDLQEIVTQLIRANPRRAVWGSDWPHTQRHEDRNMENPEETEPFLKIDNPKWIQKLSTWLSEEEWQDMWDRNPRELYDYSP
ncbi:amidohydrolase 2 [Thozetella sp. PMI_491]|nr:amidohydrolase 2 [Thozetella sp. PMI_491]